MEEAVMWPTSGRDVVELLEHLVSYRRICLRENEKHPGMWPADFLADLDRRIEAFRQK
jgi:hypothetical protein